MEKGYEVRWEEVGRGYGVNVKEGYGEEGMWKRGMGLGGRRREGGMELGKKRVWG